MFDRKKEQTKTFVLNSDEVCTYFKDAGFLETNYKVISAKEIQNKKEKELNRYLEQMDWIKGYEFLGQNYVIYHGKNEGNVELVLKKYMQIAKEEACSEGIYNKGNENIEYFMVRDQKGMTCYLYRVGVDLIKVFVSTAQEEELKQTMKEINQFVYKIEKKGRLL